VGGRGCCNIRQLSLQVIDAIIKVIIKMTTSLPARRRNGRIDDMVSVIHVRRYV